MKALKYFVLTGMITTLFSPVFAEMPGRKHTGHHKMSKRIERFDTNKDETLDAKEFKAMQTQNFERMDQDKDGFLTQKDQEMAFRARIQKRQEHLQKRWAEKAKARLEKFDANKDDHLSKEEFLAQAPGFTALDINKDGRLSQEELKKGWKHHKKSVKRTKP